MSYLTYIITLSVYVSILMQEKKNKYMLLTLTNLYYQMSYFDEYLDQINSLPEDIKKHYTDFNNIEADALSTNPLTRV